MDGYSKYNLKPSVGISKKPRMNLAKPKSIRLIT